MNWIKVSERLPNENEPCLVWRCNGQNTDHIAFAQRQHKYGTREEWEWLETSGGAYAYWGKAVDGSNITHWMPLPEPPENEGDV